VKIGKGQGREIWAVFGEMMALAGHSNIATTQRYIDLCSAILKAAVELV